MRCSALCGVMKHRAQAGLSPSPCVQAVIMGCLSAGVLPQDASGLYFLISSPEVSQKGFCVDYCGWHDVGPNNMLCGPKARCCHTHPLSTAC